MPFGIFGACSTSMEGLALASFIINGNGANYILTGTASHNGAAERQFRYPTEYGGQKPPTAQTTATGAGYAIIAKKCDAFMNEPKITMATIGKVIDMGMTDPFNMGGAMAPAAVDTIAAHFKDTNRTFEDYDLIVTGDLGKVGRSISLDLLHSKAYIFRKKNIRIAVCSYTKKTSQSRRASGAASSSTVIYGHLLKQMKTPLQKNFMCGHRGTPVAVICPTKRNDSMYSPCSGH